MRGSLRLRGRRLLVGAAEEVQDGLALVVGHFAGELDAAWGGEDGKQDVEVGGVLVELAVVDTSPGEGAQGRRLEDVAVDLAGHAVGAAEKVAGAADGTGGQEGFDRGAADHLAFQAVAAATMCRPQPSALPMSDSTAIVPCGRGPAQNQRRPTVRRWVADR